MPTTRNLAILIFEDVEVLDFCGPFGVFSVANRFADPPAFNIFSVAERPGWRYPLAGVRTVRSA
jgi:hypothetical protein